MNTDAAASIEMYVDQNGDWFVSNDGGTSVISATFDAATLREFGEGYAVEVAGLEGTVQWQRRGTTDLFLYIPYRLTITPRRLPNTSRRSGCPNMRVNT